MLAPDRDDDQVKTQGLRLRSSLVAETGLSMSSPMRGRWRNLPRSERPSGLVGMINERDCINSRDRRRGMVNPACLI